jgi:hypothetical protein
MVFAKRAKSPPLFLFIVLLSLVHFPSSSSKEINYDNDYYDESVFKGYTFFKIGHQANIKCEHNMPEDFKFYKIVYNHSFYNIEYDLPEKKNLNNVTFSVLNSKNDYDKYFVNLENKYDEITPDYALFSDSGRYYCIYSNSTEFLVSSEAYKFYEGIFY